MKAAADRATVTKPEYTATDFRRDADEKIRQIDTDELLRKRTRVDSRQDRSVR